MMVYVFDKEQKKMVYEYADDPIAIEDTIETTAGKEFYRDVVMRFKLVDPELCTYIAELANCKKGSNKCVEQSDSTNDTRHPLDKY